MRRLMSVVWWAIASALVLAAAPPRGTPAAVRYIGDATVAAALASGGPILQDPGLTIAARRAAAGTATLDPATHHILLIQQGEATLVTGGKVAGPAIEGGQNRRLRAGDVVVIPARTPYWWREVPGGTLTYLAISRETPASGNTWGLPDVVQHIGATRIRTRMAEPGGPADPLLIDPGVVFYAQRKFKDDEPEIHLNHSHIFILMDGEATFLTGEPGARIEQGRAVGATQLHQLKQGGIMIVPSKTPHQWVSIRNNTFGPKDAIGYIAINMDDPR